TDNANITRKRSKIGQTRTRDGKECAIAGRIEVDRAKVDVIAKLPHPTTVKGVRSFLGHAGFYRRFIQDFSKIARPMTHLLEKETPFVFSKDCIDAFQTLKKKLTEAPILVVPDWNLPFELMCDASDFAIEEESSSEEDILDIENQFKIDEVNKINYRSNNNYTPRPETRNYYPRPTPPDMQYEERQGLTQARYDGTTIYEWNIDGQTEYQILNLLQEMTMASNAYKTRNSNEEKIVKVLISGFTGSLKGWWDNYVTDMEKAIICSAKKTIVKVENNVQVQTQEDDMVNTLIYAILKNFVGNPHTYQERSSSILLNLTCRKLSDFRWYKDVFITKVTTRPDCKEAYWKERINELNVSEKLRSQIMKIMINDESDISDYEEDDLNILEDESTSDNELEINESQADKEAVIKYYNSFIQESPSTSTPRSASNLKLSKENVEIAKKIDECQNDEDFARIISQIRK
ncbi:reverse transcriptase domain-containing protein, partial [Tanacetum coccineum]